MEAKKWWQRPSSWALGIASAAVGVASPVMVPVLIMLGATAGKKQKRIAAVCGSLGIVGGLGWNYADYGNQFGWWQAAVNPHLLTAAAEYRDAPR